MKQCVRPGSADDGDKSHAPPGNGDGAPARHPPIDLQRVLRRSNVCTDNSPGRAVPDAVKSRYVIQLERPGERVDMEFVRALLGDTGVELDAGYGPIPVNPGLGRFVPRPSARVAAAASITP